MKKRMKAALFSGVFSLLSAIPVFAGTWQQDGPVWTYTKDDGTKATSEWIQDKEKWYHFGSDSIMQTGWMKIVGFSPDITWEPMAHGFLATFRKTLQR